jgi:hypothetical protein
MTNALMTGTIPSELSSLNGKENAIWACFYSN